MSFGLSTGMRHGVYFVDTDAVVILEVFSKKTRATPKKVIDVCQARLRSYRELRS